MKPVSQTILDDLNAVLAAELVAINQYFLFAEVCGHRGLKKLHDAVRADSIDEMKHAEVLIERILYLEGKPIIDKLGKIEIHEAVPNQFEADLRLEQEAIARLNKAIASCAEAGDNATADLLTQILKSEEEHVDWIEKQQSEIELVGLENYLAQQIG